MRELLEPGPAAEGRIGYRRVEATEAVAISEVVNLSDALMWVQGALAELYATVTAQGARICGPAGGIFADELIANERGLATVFVPFAGDIRRTGRLTELVVPAAELVTVVHAGSYHDFDLAYGALATHVAQHAISVDEPIREYFLVGPPRHPRRNGLAHRNWLASLSHHHRLSLPTVHQLCRDVC